MEESFSSGSFGEVVCGFSKFHDYVLQHKNNAGYCNLYSVISGERKLFLKAVRTDSGAAAENLARLQREYKIQERLYGNDHIVHCIGWREDAKVGPCIVMEYIDGETLTEFLKSKPSAKEKLRILNELLDAMNFIHSYQIVHNDLKPDNILITRNGHNVKLIDFGYADTDSNIDKSTGGTVIFASPELVGRKETDASSDIYSLGFIIEALFPHRFRQISQKCRKKDPKKRFQNVKEIIHALYHRKVLVKFIYISFAATLTSLLLTILLVSKDKITLQQDEYVFPEEQFLEVGKKYHELIQSMVNRGLIEDQDIGDEFTFIFGDELLALYEQLTPKKVSDRAIYENEFLRVYKVLMETAVKTYNHLPRYNQTIKIDPRKADTLAVIRKQLSDDLNKY